MYILESSGSPSPVPCIRIPIQHFSCDSLAAEVLLYKYGADIWRQVPAVMEIIFYYAQAAGNDIALHGKIPLRISVHLAETVRNAFFICFRGVLHFWLNHSAALSANSGWFLMGMI